MRYAILLASAAVLVCMPGSAPGQTLQQRKPSAAGAPLPAGQKPGPPAGTSARDALPQAAEGEYKWGAPGEVIQLYVEGAELRGYLTRRSERRDAGSAPMTFRFAEAATVGSQISFATRHIHGDWYSFEGHVMRGPVRTPREDGYYLLAGTLKIHLDAASVAPSNAPSADGADAAEVPAAGTVTREVTLKLTGSSQPAAAP